MKIRLRLLALLCILVGTGVTRAQNQSDGALSGKVDEVVLAQMREQKIPGVSLAVMRDGKIIKATGYGLANVELNAPVTAQSLFHTESLAKAFTATAVMMLVEEGKIGLDDKIAKYLPEAPPAWDEVTIRRLLTHTSGIRDYFGEDGDPTIDLHRGYTEDELVRSFASQTMRFPTGQKWSYCNAGYVILGVVIHRVRGKFWFDFVKERIFDPLGMTATRLISPDDIIMNRASGYQMLSGEWKNEPWVAPEWKTADGMLYTNVFDMAKWDAALYTEKLIKRSSLEQMWTPVKLNSGTTYPYGFAWRIREVNGHRLIQHDGVGPAFTTRFARYVNDRLSIVVFMNLGEDEEALMPTRMTDSLAAIYIPSLGDSKSQTSASDASKSTPSVPRDRPLSPQQAEVWKGEENLQTYEQQKDLKRYLSIWDEHFVGWPDYDQRPAYKPEFEASTAEEFKKPATTGPPLPPPRPEAIGLFGDVAVTHYFWPEADQSSPTVFRITHTWQKGPAGWHIIGGMSCEVPRSGGARASEEARPEDVDTPDHIIEASYQALSDPVGAPRQWKRYLSLLDPQARLVSSSTDAAGQIRTVRWSRDEYAASANDYLVKTGFTDRKLGCTTNQFGNVATVRCGFEGLEQSKLVERGVAIYQLYSDGQRWWIQSVVWDQERPGNPVPPELLINPAVEQQEVLKASQAWRDAFNRRDLDAVARYLDDDFLGSADDGVFLSKARLLKRLAAHTPEEEQRGDVQDVRVRVEGDSAVVNYLVTVREGGFEPAPLSFQFRRTEFFRKKNDAWVAIAAHESPLPINHRVAVKANPRTFKDYAGQYTFRPGFPATYTVEGDRLIDEFKGDKTEAFPMGKDTFFEREDLGWVKFIRDQQGRVTGYVYHYADGQEAAGRRIK